MLTSKTNDVPTTSMLSAFSDKKIPVDLYQNIGVGLSAQQVLSLTDEYVARGNLESARNLLRGHQWDTTLSSDKYESLYLVAGVKYLVLLYKNKPCPKFKFKYLALCVAYGLEEPGSLIVGFNMENFLSILKSQDLHTIKYFAKILIDDGKMDWQLLRDRSSTAIVSCDACAWIYELCTNVCDPTSHIQCGNAAQMAMWSYASKMEQKTT